MSLGQKLKELRKEKELTIREVSKIFSIGKSTLSEYENDNRNPSHQIIVKFAEFYDVTPDYLLGITKERNIYRMEGNKLPKALRDIGIEYMELAKHMQDKEISAEDVKKIIDILKKE